VFLDWISPAQKTFIGGMLMPIVRVPFNFINMALDFEPLIGLKRSTMGRGFWFGESDANKEKRSVGRNQMFIEASRDKEQIKRADGKLTNRYASGIVHNAVDSRIRAIAGAAIFGSIGALVMNNLFKDDDDEDKIFEVTASGDMSNPANNRDEREKTGRKDYSFRVKVGGKWTPWIFYNQAPMIMFAMSYFGKLSDRYKYKREEFDALDLNKDMLNNAKLIALEMGLSNYGASMEFVTKGSALLNIADMSKQVMEVTSDKSGSPVLNYAAKVLGRTSASLLVPNVYDKFYSYQQYITGNKRPEVSKVDDFHGFTEALADNFASRVPFLKKGMKTAYDDLGQEIKLDIPYEVTELEMVVNIFKSFYPKETVERAGSFVEGKKGVYASDVLKDIYSGGRSLYLESSDGLTLKEQGIDKIKSFKLAADKIYLTKLKEMKSSDYYDDLEGDEVKTELSKLRTEANNDALNELNTGSVGDYFILK